MAKKHNPKKPAQEHAAALLKTDKGQMQERTLPKTENTCRVCKKTSLCTTWLVREMMIPTREDFEYFACPHCGCMQICRIPANIGDYYQGGYYSYAKPALTYLPQGAAPKPDVILDVGCGAGAWLCGGPASGFSHLYGCDPFIEGDIAYDNGVVIKKCTIHQMDGAYDFIRLNHSFEHMSDAHEVMQSIRRLLKPDGVCHVGIPVYPNLATDIYGPFWYQMDAPRHYILHSAKSMRLLAEQNGLSIADIQYVGNDSQIIRSRLYQMDIPYYEQTRERISETFSAADIQKIKELAHRANRQRRGDSAVFLLRQRADARPGGAGAT